MKAAEIVGAHDPDKVHAGAAPDQIGDGGERIGNAEIGFEIGDVDAGVAGEFASKGSWCGTTTGLGAARLARDKPVAASVSKRTVVDLRAFFEDLAVWGWADRPTRQLVFASDIPRLDRPMPKALPPDVDRDLMAAVAGLADPFARHGLAILRGTGMRLGELLDLELRLPLGLR